MHLTALIESCPYMPTTFRDFVKLAGRMGPAQPLEVKACQLDFGVDMLDVSYVDVMCSVIEWIAGSRLPQ